MSPSELWQAYLAIHPQAGPEPEVWSFGVEADYLADLVVKGIKTATSSAHALYALAGEEVPTGGGYDILLDSKGHAVCILETTKVYTCPFDQVSPAHAYAEGEGDRTLAYWRQVHERFFRLWLEEAGLSFSEDMLVVCEEFRVVYPLSDI